MSAASIFAFRQSIWPERFSQRSGFTGEGFQRFVEIGAFVDFGDAVGQDIFSKAQLNFIKQSKRSWARG